MNAAVSIDNLDLKWEIDAARLRNRLDRTTPVEQVAISAMSEAFWFHFNEDTHYPSLIQELNGLFRSTAPLAEIQRPRRLMPALLKKDGEKAGACRTAPQQDPPSQDQPITSPGDRAPTEGPEEMDGMQDAPPPRDNGDAETPGRLPTRGTLPRKWNPRRRRYRHPGSASGEEPGRRNRRQPAGPSRTGCGPAQCQGQPR